MYEEGEMFSFRVKKELEKDKCLQEGLMRIFMKKIMVTCPKFVTLGRNDTFVVAHFYTLGGSIESTGPTSSVFL